MSDNSCKKNHILAAIFLILLITFISFYPSLKNELLKWDDNVYVNENPLIRNLSLNNLKTIFTTYYYTFYHPLTVLSYAIEYHFFKLDPFIYHMTNLILHLLNTLLVFWFIFLLTGKISSSLIASTLFGIHPLHVESVVWISERKDLLATVFFLGAIIAYVYYRKSRSVKFYYLCIFIFILSLLSKPMGITLPFVLFLYDYLFRRKFNRKSIIEKIPFFLLSLVWIGITMKYFYNKVPPSKFKNILIAFYGIVFYLSKIFVPVKLSAIYPHPVKDILELPVFLISPLIVILLISLVLISKKYTRIIFFGSSFFLITILPVLQVIANTAAITADRYTYIPYIGLFYITGEGFSWLYVKHSKMIKIFLLIILIVITGTLSFLTFQRCKAWRDNMTLWNDVLAKYPDVYLAHYNRAIEYESKGDYDKAILDYDQSIKIEPGYAEAYINRGNTYYKIREYDRAILDYNQALKIKPASAIAYTSRGNAYFDKGDYNRAIHDYNQAVTADPNFAESYNNRGTFYGSVKEYGKALLDFDRALMLNPYYIEAYYNRAMTYSRIKEYDKAWKDVKKIQSMGYQIAPEFLEKLRESMEKK